MINLICKSFKIENIEAIIFDKDGTIIDANIYWSEIIKLRASIILKEYDINKNFYSQICESMGLNLKTNKLLPDGPIAIKSRNEVINSLLLFLKKIEINILPDDAKKIFRKVHEKFSLKLNKFIKPIDSSINLIRNLSQCGVKLALITSDTTLNAKNTLRKLKLDSYFDIVIGGDIDLKKKSTGEPAIYICEKLNLDAKKVIAIGDAEMDFQMSSNAKLLNCILVATGQTPLNKLKLITNQSISDLSELKIYSD